MALKVEVETAPESGSWNDYTSLTQLRSLKVVSQGGAEAGTAEALLRDAAGTAVVLPECGFRVTDGSTVVFRGKIKKRGKTERPTRTRYKWYAITAQDVTSLLVDDVVDTGGVRSTAENDKARIEWLLTTFGTKGVTGGTAVQALYGSNLPEQDFTGLNLYEAIAEVAKFSGGSFYVDTTLALHHFATESNSAPFNLSDSPNYSTTWPYATFDFPDDSMDLVNAVFVIGEGDVGEWVTDATSISTYGRKEGVFRDATLVDTTARQAAGNAILAKYKDPRGPIRMRVFKAGLRAGMTLQVTNSTWGLSAVTYRIEQVIASVIGKGEFVYDVSLQDAPVTLQNYLHERLTTINRDVKRSTNVAVDYAEQFLIGRVKVVNSLPALPDPDYPIGMQVFLTTDQKLYRNPDDVAWTASVPAGEIVGGITSTQIADEAISTPKLQAGSVTAASIAAGAVGTDQLAANSVVAGTIAAGAIGTEALAAEIVLADKLLTTGLAGARVEIDDDGIRNYNAAEKLMVKIPTDGTDVSVIGAVEASSLVSTATAELRGANTLSAGSVTTAESSVATPTSPPVIDVTVPFLTIGNPAQPGAGLCFDPDGGAGGTTDTYWVGANPTIGNLLDLAYEYDASSGALLRTLRKTGTTQTLTTTLGSTSHVSDGADADAFDDRQVATPLTIPTGRVNPKITKVSMYVTGYNGGTPTIRGAVWSSGNTKLGETVAQVLPDEGSLGIGKSNHYDLAMTAPLSVSAGSTYRVGWYRTTSEGFQWDRDDGSGKTTYRGLGGSGDLSSISTDSDSKPNVYITYTYDVDSSVEGNVGVIVGVARQGTYIWVLDSNGWLFRYNQATLAFVDKFDLSAYVTGTKLYAGLFWDGTKLIITTATGTGASVQLRFVKVSTAGAFVSNLDATGLAINGASNSTRGGYSDGTDYWVSISGTSYEGVYAFNKTTGANVANRNFGVGVEMTSGVTWDGTYFRSWGGTFTPTKIFRWTGWDWTTESAVYWLCYTWYDITGTTHETAVSPRASVTLGRRRQMTVTTPAIPGGGAEPPDRVRVYMARGAADPGGANYDLQVTDALTARTLTTYDTGGAANPTSNNFPGGTAAELKSASTGWSLRGDGTMVLGGSSFPGSPASGAHFYRTDLGMWFFHNGTRWLSTTLFIANATAGDITPMTASGGANRLVQLLQPGCSDVWLERVEWSWYVSGGTALSGSHNWVGSFQKTVKDGGATTTLATLTINTGTLNQWHIGAGVDIDALMNNGSEIAQLDTAWTKTGTPGNLYPVLSLAYRLVAT